jgi:hypothetical protein
MCKIVSVLKSQSTKKTEVLENNRRRRRRGCGEEEVMVEIRVSKAMPACL